MKKYFKWLIPGSFILLITFNLSNLLNLIYNLSMVRMLSLSDYAVLTSLTYTAVILSVFSESIQTVITRYAIKQKNPGMLKSLVRKSFSKIIPVSFIAFALYSLFAVYFSDKLSIPLSLPIVAGIPLLIWLYLPITRGVMQGTERFFSLGINMIAESSIKLLFALFFVFIGFGLYGAFGGVIIGSSLALLLSIISLRDVFSAKAGRASVSKIYSYTLPATLSNLLMLYLFSIDVVIAPFIFGAEVAGAFAISSTLAKMLSTGVQPVIRAMFPLSSKGGSDSSKKVLSKSFIVQASLLLTGLIVIFLFPEIILKIYSGKVISTSLHVLPLLALSTVFLSISNLLVFYLLSRNKIHKVYYLFCLIPLQLLILFFTRHSPYSFAIGIVFSAVMFLIASFLFTRGKDE